MLHPQAGFGTTSAGTPWDVNNLSKVFGSRVTTTRRAAGFSE
jgi:hypothetical protein